MSLLIPPRTGESAGFYDDNEQNDRTAARLIGEALGNTAMPGVSSEFGVADVDGMQMQTTELPFGLGKSIVVFRFPPHELPN